jgi:hypothetical protein
LELNNSVDDFRQLHLKEIMFEDFKKHLNKPEPKGYKSLK